MSSKNSSSAKFGKVYCSFINNSLSFGQICKVESRKVYNAMILSVYWYGCEAKLLAVWKECSLRVSENRLLRIRYWVNKISKKKTKGGVQLTEPCAHGNKTDLFRKDAEYVEQLSNCRFLIRTLPYTPTSFCGQSRVNYMGPRAPQCIKRICSAHVAVYRAGQLPVTSQQSRMQTSL